MPTEKLDHALRLASMGFYVFPIAAGKKTPPLMKGWQNAATRDEAAITKWFAHTERNIGISTSRFGDSEALVVIDVDNKNGKDGDGQLFELEFAGCELPATYNQQTPTGGRHLVYRCDVAVRQGANVLGDGLDIRSRGGFVVGAGSIVGGRPYTAVYASVSPAPAWLIERCGKPRERTVPTAQPAEVDLDAATRRAVHYLEHEAPLSVEGEGGDETAFKVAARLKDFGVEPVAALDLLLGHWNERCSPPWPLDDLGVKLANAYRYGTEQPGAAAPEAVFEIVDTYKQVPTKRHGVQDYSVFANREQSEKSEQDSDMHPFDILNTRHAYVLAGGGDHILWETTDKDGRATLEHLSIGAFQRRNAAWTINAGKRDEQVTELWMRSTRRRSYDGMVFMPEKTAPDRFYNLWRGFAVEPLPRDVQPTEEMKNGVEKFLDHARGNVCRGEDSLYRWLIGYFAHLVQRPWEKPLVALVFRGGKGVGKNALVERVGGLLGGHFLLTSNRRFMVGNFNGHLENCLMFALDEAFWSGDKQAEGQLKDLITGKEHVIEHKGKEHFRVENLTRIVIIGNEDWLVPSTADERRFAVFDVGDGRKKDKSYFVDMRESLEAGGYRYLLRFLLDYDLTGIDINEAPQTAGLLDQKHATLDPFQQWWLDCLTEGRILSGDFDTDWPRVVECERFRSAFRRYVKERNIRSRIPEDKSIGRTLKRIGGSLVVPSKARSGNGFVNVYRLPDLAEMRKAWDDYIGHTVEWPE